MRGQNDIEKEATPCSTRLTPARAETAGGSGDASARGREDGERSARASSDTARSAREEGSEPPIPPELAERFERLATWRNSFEQTVRSLPERLSLLNEFGLTDHDLAAAIPDAKARAVRRWRTSGPPTTRVSEIWRAVDDLYYMVSQFLADGSLDEDAIIAWLRSRQPELFGERPLEVVCAGNFKAVSAAAEAVLASGAGARDEDLAPVAPLRARAGKLPVLRS